MKQFSNMGGGEFEFDPNGLEIKINKRNKVIEDTFNRLEEILEDYSKAYVRERLGTK